MTQPDHTLQQAEHRPDLQTMIDTLWLQMRERYIPNNVVEEILFAYVSPSVVRARLIVDETIRDEREKSNARLATMPVEAKAAPEVAPIEFE